MTKLEVIKENQRKYAEAVAEISSMSDGLAKIVKQEMVLVWLKGNKWLGGLSDSVANKLIEKISKLGYDEMQVINEFENQIMSY
mgnify:FL=1